MSLRSFVGIWTFSAAAILDRARSNAYLKRLCTILQRVRVLGPEGQVKEYWPGQRPGRRQPRATPWEPDRLKRASPERAQETSIPNVALVVVNSVFLQECPEFVLKAQTPMMGFLVTDVPLH